MDPKTETIGSLLKKILEIIYSILMQVREDSKIWVH